MSEGAEEERAATPRGKAAAPIEERRGSQRERIFEAGTAAFAEDGYAATTAAAIAKRAGMSKATFYEQFSSKDELLFELFDHGAWTFVRDITTAWNLAPRATDYEAHMAHRIQVLLETWARHPELTLIVFLESQAAGDEGRTRRDDLIANFASASYYDNQEHAPSFNAPVFCEREDALVAIYSAIEMALRQIRTGEPETMDELVPLLTRLMFGTLRTT